jgi:Ca2+-binding EF-hand superfamily protein
LASIFDAADEDNVGELPHLEMARLLSATLPGFGLEIWDIHLLMTSAQENDDGYIECKPFTQAAPEIINSLRKRRMHYRGRGLPGVEVPQEAVKHCFTDEVTKTANELMKVFEECAKEEPICAKYAPKDAVSPSDGNGAHKRRSISKPDGPMGMMGELGADEPLIGIRRRYCQECIASLPERLSPQETMRLMQMLPEDEDGYVMINELIEYLEHLRTDAMLNALVESDVLSLRTHLVLQFRRLGLNEESEGKMNLWLLKDALLQADQVCLSRNQIHALLCLAAPDSFGIVKVAEFLGMCCVMIPHMFDAKLFVETVDRLILEHAEAMRRAENEELAALGAARVGAVQEGEEAQATIEVDQETVEKTLQQILTMNDDEHKTPPALPADKIYRILSDNEKEIQGLQLTSFEVTGFAAEMQMDMDGFVPYVEHIKKWVPIIFEQRKDQLLGRYVEQNSYETLGLAPPDLNKLETMFPLLPNGAFVGKAKHGSRRSSRRHSSGRRASEPRAEQEKSPSDQSMQRTDSKGNLVHRDSKARRASFGSKQPIRRQGSKSQPEVLKEPPPGRGYGRRKGRLAAEAANALAAAEAAAAMGQ